jgi:hypothetical protein
VVTPTVFAFGAGTSVELGLLELFRFVADEFGQMNLMCEQAGLSERGIYDRTKEVMEFFGFPFEEPPPR